MGEEIGKQIQDKLEKSMDKDCSLGLIHELKKVHDSVCAKTFIVTVEILVTLRDE